MPSAAVSIAGLCVIIVTVVAILRRAEVRLTLILSALVLGALASDPMRIVTEFLAGLTDEKFLLPIGTCMDLPMSCGIPAATGIWSCCY